MVLGASISTAASKRPFQQNCSAASPYLSLGPLLVLCAPVPPCAAGRNLLGRCLCGPFCAMATCVGSLQPLSPSAWRGFVRLTHFSRSALCVAGLRALGLSSPGRPLPPGVYVNLFHLTACTLCLGGCLFFFWLCRDGCVAYSFLYETIIIIHL